MIYAEAVCLTSMLLIGIFSAYTDFSWGTIPNKLILIGLAIGVLCHITLLVLGVAPFYVQWLLCMLIADMFAFGLFWGRLWAAGDAKLFMILFFLVPPRLFDKGDFSNGIIPYIFIFIPALVWILGDSVLRIIRKEPRKKISFNFTSWLMNCLRTIIEVTTMHSLFIMLFPSFVESNAMLSFAIMMAYAYICGSVSAMRHKLTVVLHVLALITIWIIMKWNITVPDFKGYLVLVFVMFIQYIAGLYNYQLIQTSDATKGMIPAMETVLLFQTSRINHLPVDCSEQLTAKMTTEQAEAVKKWGISAKGKSTIWIVRKVPFAFMISFGFITWMLFKLLR